MSQQTKELPKGYCKLKNVIISYPHLEKPSAGAEGGNETYNVQIRFPKEDEANVKVAMAAIKEGLIEKFSDDKKKWPALYKDSDFSFDKYFCKTGKEGFPLRDGNRLDDEKAHGMAFVNSRNKTKPELWKKVEGGKKRLATESAILEELYPGAICDVVVVFYGYDSQANKGVGCSLQGIVKMADGERLGGGGIVADLSEYGEEVLDGDLDFDEI